MCATLRSVNQTPIFIVGVQRSHVSYSVGIKALTKGEWGKERVIDYTLTSARGAEHWSETFYMFLAHSNLHTWTHTHRRIFWLSSSVSPVCWRWWESRCQCNGRVTGFKPPNHGDDFLIIENCFWCDNYIINGTFNNTFMYFIKLYDLITLNNYLMIYIFIVIYYFHMLFWHSKPLKWKCMWNMTNWFENNTVLFLVFFSFL